MNITKETIEQLIKVGDPQMTEAELAAFMERLTPQLEAWAEDFGEVPYELVHAYLDGFLCCIAVMET